MSDRPADEDLQRVLELFDEVPPGLPLSSGDVAERLDVSPREAYQHLMFLVEDGYLASKKVDHHDRLWWDPDTVEEISPLIEFAGTTADGILIVDGDDVIRYANPALAEIVDQERADLIGRPLSEVTPELTGVLEQAGTGLETVTLETPTGEAQRWDALSAPLPGQDDGGRGVILRDAELTNGRERELENQRNRLSTLHHLSAVIREIILGTLDTTRREVIEETACDRLVSTGAYEAAWVGELERPEGLVTPRAGKGVSIDELEPIPVDRTLDPLGPSAGFALLEEGQIQVASVDELELPVPDGLSDRSDGVGSVAIIPIVTGALLEGLLFIYSNRENAFEGFERDVIDGLGELIGHAIATTRRRDVLNGGQVTEVVVELEEIDERCGVEQPEGTQLTLDRITPVGDRGYQLFGTCDPEALEFVEAIAAVVPSWDDIEVLEADAGEAQVKVNATGSALIDALIDLGGRLERIDVQDNTAEICMYIPPGGDVRRVVEIVDSNYPGAKLVSTGRVEEPVESGPELDEGILARLTERQQSILEAAYHNGYFDNPRGTTGIDLAEEFGIAGATLNEHLRLAQQKVFEEIFSSSS